MMADLPLVMSGPHHAGMAWTGNDVFKDLNLG